MSLRITITFTAIVCLIASFASLRIARGQEVYTRYEQIEREFRAKASNAKNSADTKAARIERKQSLQTLCNRGLDDAKNEFDLIALALASEALSDTDLTQQVKKRMQTGSLEHIQSKAFLVRCELRDKQLDEASRILCDSEALTSYTESLTPYWFSIGHLYCSSEPTNMELGFQCFHRYFESRILLSRKNGGEIGVLQYTLPIVAEHATKHDFKSEFENLVKECHAGLVEVRDSQPLTKPDEVDTAIAFCETWLTTQKFAWNSADTRAKKLELQSK